MTAVLLQAVQLSKQYREGEHAVRVLTGLDLVIRQAERVAIIGESGVGKSTLLHILGTLDPPTAGQVLLNDQDLFALPELELAALRNRDIGFIFQLHHLLPDFSALENVMMPGLIARLSQDDARARAAEMLDRATSVTRSLWHRLRGH